MPLIGGQKSEVRCRKKQLKAVIISKIYHYLITIPAKTVDEPRFLVIGKISEKHWSAIITFRDDRIRIISLRRSRPEEVDIYEG